MGARTIGVLALQGAFARHVAAFRRLGADAVEVRRPAQLDDVDALVIPGGESGTMSMLLERAELFDPIAERLADGHARLRDLRRHDPARHRDPRRPARPALLRGHRHRPCGATATAARSTASTASLDISALDGAGDAPVRRLVHPGAGRRAGGRRTSTVLARVDDRPVLCTSGPVMVAAFHPELPAPDGTSDLRIHRHFLEEVL